MPIDNPVDEPVGELCDVLFGIKNHLIHDQCTKFSPGSVDKEFLMNTRFPSLFHKSTGLITMTINNQLSLFKQN